MHVHPAANKKPSDRSHLFDNGAIQESPAVADKPARRDSMPKIAPIRRAYNVVADKIHSFSCCCVRNLRNPEKFSENSNL